MITEICAFESRRHEPADVLIVARAELKTLPFTAGVPDQVGQKRRRVVVAQLHAVAQRAAIDCLLARELHPSGRKQRAVHPRADHLAQPVLEILEQVAEPLKHRIGRAGLAVFPAAVGKPALHVQTRRARACAARPPWQRSGRSCRGSVLPRSATSAPRRQKRVVKPVRPAARSCARQNSPTGAAAAGDRRRRCAACPENRTCDSVSDRLSMFAE